MTAHRGPWTVTAVLVALTGALAAYSAWPFVAFTSAFIWTTLLVAVTTWSYRDEREVPWYRPWQVGVVAGVAVVALIGWSLLMGFAGVLLVLLVALFSPPALRGVARLARWTRRGTSLPKRPDPPEPSSRMAAASAPSTSGSVLDDQPVVRCPATPPASMDDDELCWAWRVSYVALQHAPSVSARLGAVQTRQEYLDELERRNPEGLAAWLCSGARAAGDPRPYIVEGKHLRSHSVRNPDPSRLRPA